MRPLEGKGEKMLKKIIKKIVKDANPVMTFIADVVV